jgi:hypothetical protein
MLNDTIEWRKKHQLRNLESWKDVLITENSTGKAYVRGYDKEGHVIVVMRPANENTNNHDGNIKHLIYTMERAVACLQKTGQEKLILLIDFDRYSIFNAPPMKTSREVLSILQDHYPERLCRAFCVRPPAVFYAFYKVISPFIDPVTVAKIAMLTNADVNNPRNQLHQEVNKTILEPIFGGTDSRPFDSSKYLGGDFSDEFCTVLDKLEEIQKK